MKSLAEQMRNHDREQMSRMAHNLPEQYQERAPVEQVAQVFNKLFNELRAAFPASMANFRTQEDLNEFRRQWLLAFQENGIHSMAQVDAGMRIARRRAPIPAVAGPVRRLVQTEWRGAWHHR